MNTRYRLACVLFTLAIAPFANAGIIAVLDADAWAAALPGGEVRVNEFAGPRRDLAADSVNTLGGIEIELLGGAGDPGPTGPDGNGWLRGELDASGADALALELRFPATRGIALLGLRNDSPSSPANLDLAEIALGVGGEHWILSDLLGAARGAAPFIGFVSDRPVTALSMFHAGTISTVRRSSESFHLDGLALVSAATSAAVPEPTPLALSIAGLLGLAWRRRHRGAKPRNGKFQSTAATASTKAGICASRSPAMLTRLSPVI